MKRATLLALLASATLLLAAGAVLAATRCDGGLCGGTSKDDTIYGSAGYDKINGARGDDVLLGNGGNDIVKGGPNVDRVRGDNGDDVVKGGSGRDTINGNAGNDQVLAGAYRPGVLSTNDRARDIIDCGPGNDDVYYVPGQDVIRNCEVKHAP